MTLNKNYSSRKRLTPVALCGALILTATLSTTLLSGCVVVVDGDKKVTSELSSSQLEKKNRAAIAGLTLGSQPASVLTLMGTPDFDEQLTKGDATYRVLYYRTQRLIKDGLTTKDECTPLVFQNGELIGWGQEKLRFLNQD